MQEYLCEREGISWDCSLENLVYEKMEELTYTYCREVIYYVLRAMFEVNLNSAWKCTTSSGGRPAAPQSWGAAAFRAN